MEYSDFAGMAGSNCGTCVAEARQSKPRRRTRRKMAQIDLLYLEMGAR
jgi:bacterioferritin-associated ferredoxin